MSGREAPRRRRGFFPANGASRPDWGKEMNISAKIKKRVAIGLAVAALLCCSIYIWQDRYFRLPEGEVKEMEDPEEDSPAVLAGYDRFDILLLGLDSREDPSLGMRTDTMILVSIDTTENKAKLLTIPRDTRVKYKGSWMKINGAFNYDKAAGSVQAVEELLDTKIDRYAVVDFEGVTELVDLMGGIDVDVPFRMHKPLEGIELDKGPQHLNGEQALGYMRYRDATHSDFDRSDRQKEVLIQLADKMVQPANLMKIGDLFATAQKYMETDITIQEVGALAKLGREILNNGVESQLLPGEGGDMKGGWYYIPYTSELGLAASDAEVEYKKMKAEAAAEEARKRQAEQEAAAAGEGGDAGAETETSVAGEGGGAGAEAETPAADEGGGAGAEAETPAAGEGGGAAV